jgi:hypothetical protein
MGSDMILPTRPRRYPRVHGGPVHVGDPAQIGIADLATPDYGDAVTVRENEVGIPSCMCCLHRGGEPNERGKGACGIVGWWGVRPPL